MTNHFRDQEEEFDKIKLLTRFINPQAAAEVWDKKKTEVTVSTKNVLYEQMSKDLKNKYTAEELELMMSDPKHYTEDLTKIEKA